jgi:Arc/MetJ family transcription regulator
MTAKKIIKSVKKRKPLAEQSEFVQSVMRAALRARDAARKLAKMHGTPIVYMRNGKIIEEYL